jgi:lysophospholipase L1-like esterase
MKVLSLIVLAACGQPTASAPDGAVSHDALDAPALDALALDALTLDTVPAHRVLAVGDSLTLGAPELVGGYRAPLAALDPSLIFVGRQDSHGLHEGYSGQRVAQIRALVLPTLDTLAPRTVLLMAGANDITIGTPNDVILADLRQLAEEFKAHAGVERVIVGTIPFRAGTLRDATIAFNAALPGAFVGASLGIEVVDVSSSLVFPTDFGDSTHPNAAGYAKMAGQWFAAAP